MSQRLPHQITAGFMPLLDSTLLVAAKEKDFAAAEGVDLTLMRETSWANIRDRLAVGHFQVAHMLAPMPIACNLGLTPLASRTVAPMALGLGGNAVTVLNALWGEMETRGARADFDAMSSGLALKAVLADRSRTRLPPLRFAVVHPHSRHNYELRHWLADAGRDRRRQHRRLLRWRALEHGGGGSGLRTDRHRQGGDLEVEPRKGSGRAGALGRGQSRSCCGLAARALPGRPLVRRPVQPGGASCADRRSLLSFARPADWMMPALSGRIRAGGKILPMDDFFIPLGKAATFPWKSHALWFYTQMVRISQAQILCACEKENDECLTSPVRRTECRASLST
jgi:two-component system, oxyanion-binding sensor